MQNTSLMKISEEIISSNEQMHSFLEKAKAVTIPLFPDTLNFVRPEFKLSATVVSVDTNVDKYGNNRDIYKTENGQYALHLSKLNEIAKAAGLQITDSRILERKIDGKGRVTYVLFQVKGYVKGIDGSTKEDVATGRYDYYRDLEKYVDYKTGEPKMKMINARRSFAEALAESNAKTRLFNKLVTKLPQSFTIEELKKPFLVPCVIQDKNELLKDLDPETQKQIKAEYARKQLGIANQIYNSTPTTNPLAISENSESITEVEFEEEKSVTKEEENRIIANEFRTVPQKERTEKIMNLIKLKGWKHPKGVSVTAAMIEKAPLDVQIQRLEELLNMPAVAEEVGL